MIVKDDISIEGFEAWSGGIDTKNTIIDNGLASEFDQLIAELYPDGLTATELNDILWHDTDWVYESLGIEE